MELAQSYSTQFWAARTVRVPHYMQRHCPPPSTWCGFTRPQPPCAGHKLSFNVPKTKMQLSSSSCLVCVRPWIWSLVSKRRVNKMQTNEAGSDYSSPPNTLANNAKHWPMASSSKILSAWNTGLVGTHSIVSAWGPLQNLVIPAPHDGFQLHMTQWHE